MGHRTYINQNPGVIWILYGHYDSVLAQISPSGNYDGCGPEPQRHEQAYRSCRIQTHGAAAQGN